MSNQEPSNKEIMVAVTGVKENTEQILEAIGVFSNNVEERFDKLEGRMEKLENRMSALDSSVKNYLELSDKRYLELRQTNRIMLKYFKIIADKANIPVDLTELEELVK